MNEGTIFLGAVRMKIAHYMNKAALLAISAVRVVSASRRMIVNT